MRKHGTIVSSRSPLRRCSRWQLIVWLIPSQLSNFARASDGSAKACAPDSNTSDSSIALHVMSSGTPTLRPSSWRGWKKRPWSRRLFGAAISQASTASRFVERWTESLLGFRASHSARPEVGEATKMRETSGPTFCDVSGKSSLDSCSSKTSPVSRQLQLFTTVQTCLHGSLQSTLPSWMKPLRGAGGNSDATASDFTGDSYENRVCQRLLTLRPRLSSWITSSKTRSLSLRNRLARAIGGSGCSSWPTNRSHEVGCYQNQADGSTLPTLTGAAKNWTTPNVPTRGIELSKDHRPDSGGVDLQSQASQWQSPGAFAGGSVSRGGDRIGEPLLAGQAVQWGTPTSRDHKDGSSADADVPTNGLLGRQVIRCSLPAPDWVFLALSMTSENFSDETLKQLGDALKRSAETQSGGSTSSKSRRTCAPRLNPAFTAFLMGSNWWWTRAEPISCAAREMASYRARQARHLSTLFGEQD